MTTLTSGRPDARFRNRLRALACGPELLIDLMGFGPFAEMAMTRDGVLLGRPHRSPGFDAFIGPPSDGAKRRLGRLFRELRAEERARVLERIREQGIDPSRVGVPAEYLD